MKISLEMEINFLRASEEMRLCYQALPSLESFGTAGGKTDLVSVVSQRRELGRKDFPCCLDRKKESENVPDLSHVSQRTS